MKLIYPYNIVRLVLDIAFCAIWENKSDWEKLLVAVKQQEANLDAVTVHLSKFENSMHLDTFKTDYKHVFTGVFDISFIIIPAYGQGDDMDGVALAVMHH